MNGTEFEIIPPLHTEITGSTAERLPEVHTNATIDLLAVCLKSHADGELHYCFTAPQGSAISNGLSAATPGTENTQPFRLRLPDYGSPSEMVVGWAGWLPRITRNTGPIEAADAVTVPNISGGFVGAAPKRN
jgi:hypothetical protein